MTMSENFHNYHPNSNLSSHPQTRSSKAVFARLAQPFIGSSRPPSSSGLGGGHGGLPPTSAPNSTPNPLAPRTVKYSLKSPILALSASPDNTHLVLAGREILRILSITSTTATSTLNLRAPGEQKRYFQYDVKWSPLHARSTIATAGTNGTICLYDAKEGILDRTLREHQRQVHKIAFNPADGRLLLSASQDGTVKLWDSRERGSRLTFMPRSEAVRDVQFNAANAVEFAAGFDNGSIQRWDYRNPTNPERRLSGAHSGPVFTVDWHPDGRHIASGGRDRSIKIWDFYSSSLKAKPKHNIFTLAAVSRIAWRPGHATQLATCAINNDHRVHVWDLKRPYVAARILDEHDNATTGVLWKDDEILWSVSKDETLVQNDVGFACQPINSLAHAAFSWGPDGEFTFATQTRSRPRRSGTSFNIQDDELLLSRNRHGRTSSFKGFKPLIGPNVNVLDGHLEKYVPGQAAARVQMGGGDKENFEYLAEKYVFNLDPEETGELMSLEEACTINAKAAWSVGKYRDAQTWKMIGLALSSDDIKPSRKNESPTITESVVAEGGGGGGGGLLITKRAVASEYSIPSSPLARTVFENSPKSIPTPTPGRLGMFDENLLVPPPPPAAFGTSVSSSTASTDGEDSKSENEAHVNVRLRDRSRSPRPPLTISTSTTATTPSTTGNHLEKPLVTGNSADSIALFSAGTGPATNPLTVPNTNSDHQLSSSVTEKISNSMSSSSLEPHQGRKRHDSLISERTSSSSYGVGDFGHASEDEDDRLHSIQEEIPDMTGSGLLKRSGGGGGGASDLSYKRSIPKLETPRKETAGDGGFGRTATNSKKEAEEEEEEKKLRPWAAQRMLDQVLEWYCERGDVQMCATIALLLDGKIEFDPRRTGEWVEGYAKLLNALRHHSTSALILRTTTSPLLRAAAQTNTHVDLSCGNCGRPIVNSINPSTNHRHGSWYCLSCRKLQDGCVLCREIVRGRWTGCQSCEHGGHDRCLREWFGLTADKSLAGGGWCAALGCGCECLPQVQGE